MSKTKRGALRQFNRREGADAVGVTEIPGAGFMVRADSGEKHQQIRFSPIVDGERVDAAAEALREITKRLGFGPEAVFNKRIWIAVEEILPPEESAE